MHNIHHNFIVKASPQKVFDAFTIPEGLNSWWTLKSSGIPSVGTLYTFYFGPEYDWRAEVIKVIPGRELTWKMKVCREDWLPTSVGFQLTPVGSDTSVAFFHKDWQEATEHFGITSFCWGQLLVGLKRFIEEGIVVPFEKRN